MIIKFSLKKGETGIYKFYFFISLFRYEMRKISLREGGNMFICQAVETNGENGESGGWHG